MKASFNMRAKKRRDGQKERHTQWGHGPSKAGQQKVRYSQVQAVLPRESDFRVSAVVMDTILVFLKLLLKRC